MELPNSDIIYQADAFLRNNNILSDYHKNAIVITCLCICSKAKSIGLEIDIENKSVTITYYLSLLNYLYMVSPLSYCLSSKETVVQKTSNFFSSYLGYASNVEFKIYGTKQRTS